MTVTQFRQDPDLAAAWASELKENKLLQLVMSAVETDHPHNHAVAGDAGGDISPTRAAIELGVTRGYAMCYGRFALCAVPLRKAEPLPESEYTEEEQEANAGRS